MKMTRALPLVAALISGPAVVSHADEFEVIITFTGDCPTAVSEDIVTISKAGNDRIIWRAVSESPNDDRPPYTGGYRIYFDPFKSGPPLKSGGRDTIKSKALHDNVPADVEFKYTIVGDHCPQAPLDPRIRVQ